MVLSQHQYALFCTVEFINEFIQQYAEKHTGPEPDYLHELNRYTHSSVMRPRMLSGHLQGRFLALMSNLMQPQFVLDIGTYTGYSALCLAEGLKPDGRLYTLDNNDEVMEVAVRYINQSPYGSVIIPVLGDAMDSIRKMNQNIPHWDIVWMDADKAEYSAYYDACIDHLRPGGLIMADNVLWSGKILDEKELLKDKDTAALQAFNTKVCSDARVEPLLLPIRDGIMMLRKK